MFEERGFTPLHLSFNSHRMSSIYVFAIASKNPEAWQEHFDFSFSVVDPRATGKEPYIGSAAIPNYAFRLSGHLLELARHLVGAVRRATRGS